MKLTQIENEMLTNARARLSASDNGIEIRFVQIKSIELPDSVSQVVFDRMKAERAKLVASISSSANEQSIRIRSDALNQASKLLSEADALAKDIRGEGQLAMVQSLKVMDQNPPLAKYLMDVDMLEELSKNQTTWIFDHNTTGLELLQAAKPPAPATNAPAPAHN
jgi:membrane protease subunit HflC